VRFKTLQHNEVITDARADSDLLRFQPAVSMVQEDKLPRAGLENCRCRHDQLAAEAGFEIDVDEHPWFQLETGIRNRQPHAHCAGPRIRQLL
jgi:hypothetical protein